MKLKKYFFAMAFAAACIPANAQETEEKVEFNPHAYLQLQGGAGYTLGEAEFKDLITPAAALSFGYQFTPVIGARIGASGWESAGGWVNPSINYKYNYLAGNLDVMFNLSNLFCGYNPKRIFNLNIFAGGAVNYAFNNDEAVDLDALLRGNNNYKLPYLWKDNKVFIAGRAGLAADFRLSERFSLNLEANANILSDHYNSKKADNADWYFNVLAGVSFRLGKPTKKTVVAVPTEIIPVKKEEEPKKAVEKPVVQQKPVVKQAQEHRCDVFFEINSSVITPEEATKVKTLAEFMKKNPEAKAEITGYADVQTGNANINLRLSKERVESVAKMLTTEYGIDSSRIATNHKGDTVQPFTENVKNRVCICLAK